MVFNFFRKLSAGKISFLCGIIAGTISASLATMAVAEQPYATAERSAVAIGHYARARTLLREALSEFEEGRKVARPDLFLDPEDWRAGVISRAEELNRLLDPQPRVTRSGATYKTEPALIKRPGKGKAKPAPTPEPVVKDTGYSNTPSELPPSKPVKVKEPKKTPVITMHGSEHGEAVPPTAVEATPPSTIDLPTSYAPSPTAAPIDVPRDSATAAPTGAVSVPAVAVPAVPAAAAAGAPSVPAGAAATGSPEVVKDDPEVTEAINQAIKERLERMNREAGGGTAPGGK